MKHTLNPVSRILKLVSLEKKEISQIYFYAIIYGIIILVIPVGIQALISFAQTATISTSVVLLVIFIVLSVFISGVLQVNQMRIIEKIQQKIFVRYGFGFAQKIPQLNVAAIDDFYLPELVNRFFGLYDWHLARHSTSIQYLIVFDIQYNTPSVTENTVASQPLH